MRRGLFDNLSRETQALIEHREQYTFDFQIRIETALHEPDGFEQLTETLECVVFTL